MNRREVLMMMGVAAGAACLPAARAAATPVTVWKEYARRFVSAEGRVVDTGSNGISHSEGQGVSMLLATAFDDRESFNRIWQWTQQHLMIRQDGLLSWKWDSAAGGKVTDTNNASDGDVFVAWALLRAGRLWSRPELSEAALVLIRAIREKLLRNTRHGLILLPAMDGFVKGEGADALYTVNPSYWIFPALAEFAKADAAPEWPTLTENGLKMLSYTGFGRWHLPPDWLRLTDPVTIPAGKEGRFGLDAARIPLYLIWARLDTPARLKPFSAYWQFYQGCGTLPAWTNLDDDSVDSYGAPEGVRTIAALTLARQAGSSQFSAPLLKVDDNYYSASLKLLSMVAAREIQAKRS